MHHNLAQKLCQVLGKLRQLLGDFVPRPILRLCPGPHWGTSVSQASCMCHLHVPLIFNRTHQPNKSWPRPRLGHLAASVT